MVNPFKKKLDKVTKGTYVLNCRYRRYAKRLIRINKGTEKIGDQCLCD
ncbi:hypothetical protein [Wolbachia endosymbiont of Tribolium confusum]|nr:hypothetical protein [Wolbachia endosymbiont of Tribolium confusum]MCA7010041.1 hypothetical protein [Wolbachia endosymbiont of Tribolium confusum]